MREKDREKERQRDRETERKRDRAKFCSLACMFGTWEREVLSARGFKRLAKPFEYAKDAVWRCVGRGPGGSSEPRGPLCIRFSLCRHALEHRIHALALSHTSRAGFPPVVCGQNLRRAHLDGTRSHGELYGGLYEGPCNKAFPVPHQRGPGKKIPGEIFMVRRSIYPHRS